jgi:hypothetical protein
LKTNAGCEAAPEEERRTAPALALVFDVDRRGGGSLQVIAENEVDYWYVLGSWRTDGFNIYN